MDYAATILSRLPGTSSRRDRGIRQLFESLESYMPADQSEQVMHAYEFGAEAPLVREGIGVINWGTKFKEPVDLLDSTLRLSRAAFETVTAEATAGGALRGLARWKGALQGDLLPELLGNGRLAITIDPGRGRERYQGIVELHAAGLTESLRDYFTQSEQLPTRLWLAVEEKRVAGLLLQRVPQQNPEDSWSDLSDSSTDTWLQTVEHAEGIEPGDLLDLSVPDLLARINGDRPVRLYRGEGWRFLCSCSRKKVAEVLRALGQDDLDALVEERKQVKVNCEFCNAEFSFDAVDVAQVFVDDRHDLHSTRH